MELKIYKMVDEKYCTDCVCVVPSEVYLKSESDKVIAELNAQKAQAEDDCAYWKNKYKDCKRELDLLKDTNAFYNGEKK